MSQEQDKEQMLVSIIVPVLSIDDSALCRCYNSLIKQTYPVLEIVFVNGGSVPRIASLLDSFADPRVSVIHQENKGISIARNVGTSKCAGEIITYVDSDDVLPPYAVQQAVEAFTSGNYDAVFGFIHLTNNPHQNPCEAVSGYSNRFISVSADTLLSYHLQGSLPGPWLKSSTDYVKVGALAHYLRRSLALQCPFPPNVPIAEDVAWSVRVLALCKKPLIVDSCWYFYIQNQASITHVFRPTCVNDSILAICAIGEALKDTGELATHADDYLFRVYGESNRAARNMAHNKAIALPDAMRALQSIMQDQSVRSYVKQSVATKHRFNIKGAVKSFLCKTGLNVVIFRLLEIGRSS